MDSTQVKHQATERAKQGASAISRTLQGSEFSDAITEQYEMIRERAEDAYEASVSLVKKYPVASVLGATAIGFLAASIFRRRS